MFSEENNRVIVIAISFLNVCAVHLSFHVVLEDGKRRFVMLKSCLYKGQSVSLWWGVVCASVLTRGRVFFALTFYQKGKIVAVVAADVVVVVLGLFLFDEHLITHAM